MRIQGTTVSQSDSTLSTNAIAGSGDLSSFNSALKSLNDWINETPQQRMEDSILASMGLTREEFEHMSGPEKEKIAEKVRETMKKELQAQAEQARAHANLKSTAASLSATSAIDTSL